MNVSKESTAPDFLYNQPTHFIDLEVDENQHKTKPYECDRARMVEISQALGLKTIFIRYNPDPFVTDGIKQDPGKVIRKKIFA